MQKQNELIEEKEEPEPIAIVVIPDQPRILQKQALNFPVEVIDHHQPEKPRIQSRKAAPVLIIENETSEQSESIVEEDDEELREYIAA